MKLPQQIATWKVWALCIICSIIGAAIGAMTLPAIIDPCAAPLTEYRAVLADNKGEHK